MLNSNTRWAQQKGMVRIILLVAALVLFLVSFFTRDNEAQNITRVLGWVLLVAAIVFGLFKGEIGYKPTREEIEENMFGDKGSKNEK